MRSLHIIAMLVAAIGLLVTVSLAVALSFRGGGTPAGQDRRSVSADPRVPDQGLERMKFPAFRLIDQAGDAQTQALLEGHYTIVDFVFTNCPLACPAMTGQMAVLQKSLEGTGVRFASFSLDPTNDTPARLREYASNFGIDLSTWTLLTAPTEGAPAGTGDSFGTPSDPRQQIWRIVTQGLRFELREDPGTLITVQSGKTMPNIVHTVRFVLVGPDLQILGLYSSADPEQMRMLEERVRMIQGR